MVTQAPLSELQRYTLDFIERFIGTHRFSPTIQEIADDFRVSKATAFERVQCLARKGCLRLGPKHAARSISLPEMQFRFVADERGGHIVFRGEIWRREPTATVQCVS